MTTPQEQIPQSELQDADSEFVLPSWLTFWLEVIFSSRLMLLYATFFLCNCSPLIFLNHSASLWFQGQVFLFSVILPNLILLTLNQMKMLDSQRFGDRIVRMLPLATNLAFTLCTYILVQKDHFLPNWVQMPFFAALVLSFLLLVISYWRDVSASVAYNAALAVMILFFFYYVPLLVPQWLVFGYIVVVGLLGTIRVSQGRNTLQQVGIDTLLGIGVMLLANHICA